MRRHPCPCRPVSTCWEHHQCPLRVYACFRRFDDCARYPGNFQPDRRTGTGVAWTWILGERCVWVNAPATVALARDGSSGTDWDDQQGPFRRWSLDSTVVIWTGSENVKACSRLSPSGWMESWYRRGPARFPVRCFWLRDPTAVPCLRLVPDWWDRCASSPSAVLVAVAIVAGSWRSRNVVLPTAYSA